MTERAAAVDAIKRYAPASLKVTLQDGTEKAVAVPKAGNRWARTQQILDALQWVTIECLDKDMRLVGTVELDDEDDDEDEDGLPADPYARVGRLNLDIMRATMKEVRTMFDVQIRGQAELVGSMVEGMKYLTEMYHRLLAVQATNLMGQASGGAEGGGGNDEVMRMMQMAMMMMHQPKQVGAPAPTPAPAPQKVG